MNTDTTVAEAPVKIKADLRKFSQAEQQVTKAMDALSLIVKIENKEGLESAMDTLSRSSKVDKVIEEKRKELVKPLNDEVKRINDYAKVLAGKLPPAIATAKTVVITYNNAQQKILEDNRKLIRGEQLTALGFVATSTPQLNAPVYTYEGIRVFTDTIITQDDRQWLAFFNDILVKVQAKKDELLKALEATQDLDNAFGSEDDKIETAAKIEEIKFVPSAVSFVPAGEINKVKGMTKRWTFSVFNQAEIPAEYLMIDEVKIRKAIAEGVRAIPGVTIFQQDGLTIR